MTGNLVLLPFFGVLVGVAASFSGLGGGFLMVPLLLFLGYTAQQSVGTSFVAILMISLSAVLAYGKLAHVDYRAGILLGLGGVVGAQVGVRLVDHVSTAGFRRILAVALIALSVYLFAKK